MNTQELIDGIINLSYENYKYSPYVERKRVLELVRQLDEPQSIKLKDVIARIKSFDVGAKEVWLNEILNELGSDYGLLKYKAGYEQGKFDGAIEREKVTVPRFVSDWIEKVGGNLFGLNYDMVPNEIYDWVNEEKGNFKKLHLACAIGYTVEKEKRYLVKMKNIHSYSSILKLDDITGEYFFGSEVQMCASSSDHTRKELEEAGFGEVFNSPLFEVEEVEE